jgi:hypothetical protein
LRIGKNNKPKRKTEKFEQMVIDFSESSSILNSKISKDAITRTKIKDVLKEKNNYLKNTVIKVEKLYTTNSKQNKVNISNSLNNFKNKCVDLSKLLNEGYFNKFAEKTHLNYAVKILVSEIMSIDKLLQLEGIIIKDLKAIKDLKQTYDVESRTEPREAVETLESINTWKKRLDDHNSLYEKSYPLIKNQYAKVLAMDQYIQTLLEKSRKV